MHAISSLIVYMIFIYSATGNLKVLQIADDGSSVTITNISTTEEENLGGFMLQQNVGGHLVAVFRFPPRASLRAASSTTVSH